MPEINSELDLALHFLDINREQSIGRLFDILKIPSISTQKKHKKDCLKAGYVGNEVKAHAAWLETIKELYKEQGEDNKKKIKKYLQNFSKICKMYYS